MSKSFQHVIKDNIMKTNDPALTKTRIDGIDSGLQDSNSTADVKSTQTFQETVVDGDFIHDMENLDNDSVDANMANRNTEERIAGESVTHEEPLRKVVVDEELAEQQVLADNDAREDMQHNVQNDSNEDIDDYTSIGNGTDTFKEGEIHSDHVKAGDESARQPDRRDQEGNPFDEGINEDTVGSEAPQSHEINDMNRYANVNNAQTRILNDDEKD